MKNRLFKTRYFRFFYIVLGLFILLIIFLRPILIWSEMRKVSAVNNERKYYTFFYQEKDKPQVKMRTFTIDQSGNYCLYDNDPQSKCLNQDQIQILSTEDDQELITEYFEKKYPANSDPSELLIKFEDLNKDSIDDFLLFQGKDAGTNSYVQYFNFYSAHENKFLWQIENAGNDITSDVRLIQENNIPTIVVYDNYEGTGSGYSFYKSINEIYQQVEPTKQNWRDYWSQFTLKELISDRFLGNIFNLIIVFLIILISMPIIIVTISLFIANILRKLFLKLTSNKL